ncbi:uncharacterized protein N7459_000298 [Penicillium hispanicum]|uniref:uncharacterized protein n=1 Tax=Penicillium hispanicum TaxID=1080232 RepID=UPI00254095B2|nr:uncharacterized protein N7459_000298 [Penicillium hispanicum]KAJ5594090.1 hypothetical protein N7459_000298 [Penicillium hispanicum]
MLEVPTLEHNVLDILGQQPAMYKLYTQICCIYSVPDPSAQDTIITTLRAGLNKLAVSFPWLAGNVINEGASEGNSGIFRIVPSGSIPLVIKDLQRDPAAPTMTSLRQANFPMTMLDENIIAPCLTLNLPGNTVGLAANSAPVFAVQATFITRGLMLTIVGQHNAMDMTGQSHIIDLMSKACQGQPFTADELSNGNVDRSKTIPLLGESYQPGPELAQQIQTSSQNDKSATPSPPVNCLWSYVTFPATSLRALKKLAMETKTLPSGFVSTDDAVCAFLWKCISRVRIARLASTTPSTFARAVDVRQRMGVSATYPGMLQTMTYNQDTLGKVETEPLGSIASQLRSQLDPNVMDMVYRVRSLATLLARSSDKTKASFTAGVDISTGIALSSWAKINCYNLDFNLGLGKPEAVRRPCFTVVESLFYLMPPSPDGAMAVAICLRDEDWERLKMDQEFSTYGRYIG